MNIALRLFFLLLLISCFSACQPEERKQINFPVYTPTPQKPATPHVYKLPEIGMGYDDFNKLCGEYERDKEDDISIYKTARGTTITYRLAYTWKRSVKNCWGTFTFVNGRLESIYTG